MDEARLLERLRLIEALFAGATTDGERMAAAEAAKRIQARLEGMADKDPPVEYQFSLSDGWSRKVFVALCRRYGVKPYRKRGQRRTTVMAKLSKSFVEETLWPEFEQIAKELRMHLEEVTDRIIAAAIHRDTSDARETEDKGQLLGDG